MTIAGAAFVVVSGMLIWGVASPFFFSVSWLLPRLRCLAEMDTAAL